jgi:hypothetical protein
MTDIALNSFGKPLSMTREAVRKRDYRARRDKQGANLSQAGPSNATRDKSPQRQGRVIQFNGTPVSQTVTHQQGQQLNGKDASLVHSSMSHSMSPSLAPDEVRSRALPPDIPKTVSRPGVDWTLVTLRVLGAVALLTGLGSNGTFLINQGQSMSEIAVLIGFALSYDGAVALIPRVGVRLWKGRGFVHSFAAAAIYPLCITIAALAALGFAGKNFGDTAASRGAASGLRTVIEADLARAEADRKRLTVIPTDPIQISIGEEQKEQACNPSARGYTRAKCDEKRNALAELGRNRKIEEEAKRLDDKIIDLSGKLALAPATKSVNPQSETAAMMVTELSFDTLVLKPQRALAMHYFGFIFLPMLAGFMFAWVEVLTERRAA